MKRITATAARKAAKALGPEHPAVIRWREIASRRMAAVNRADAGTKSISGSSLFESELEDAKRQLLSAMLAR